VTRVFFVVPQKEVSMKIRTAVAAVMLSLTISSLSFAMPDMKPPTEAEPVKALPIAGKVLEVLNASGYTYLLLDIDGFKDWVAIPEMYVEVGEEVELQPGVQMGQWQSKALNKTFKQILFSGGPTDKYNEKRKINAHKGADMSAPAPGNKKSEGKAVDGLKVEKAKGENAFDLAELFAKRDALQDKTILVRGQVVKVTAGVMDRNWVHIKDGTGENGANKLVITTKDSPNNGDIVTFSGVFHNNVDFGGGYQYGVILEDAVIK
jgi:hypothetical protein